ncbi:MAG: hypothetical protein RBS80_10225 [Thermoguttaceae bacterium]|nr:hypothetical protein [Thermoguttaceae bacterium]
MFRTTISSCFAFTSLTALLLAWLCICPPAAAQQEPEAAVQVPDDEPPLPAEEPADDAEPMPAAPEAEDAPGADSAPLRPNIGKKPYLIVPVDEDQRRRRNDVMGMLRNRKFDAGEEEAFDAYYRRYFLPRWTQPANLGSLPLLRRELRNNLLSGRTGPPHAKLNAIVLDYMGKMASANVHPAARVNAMLIIGELNEVEPVRAGDAPTALSAALPVLLTTLEDPDQIDPVRFAALVGIIRHAQFGRLTPEATLAIQRAMIRLASSPGAPARSSDGHAWMRSQAAKVLGMLRSAGENGAVPRLLATLVADDQLDMLVRCHAATALGQLNYAGASGLNAGQVIAALRQLTADAIRADTDQFDEDPDSFSRRRLKARLVAVHRGLVGGDDEQSRGVAPLATRPEEQQALSSVRGAVEKLLELFEDKQRGDAELVETLRTALAGLEPGRSPDTAQTAR